MWIRFSGILGLVVFLFGFVAALLTVGFSNPFLNTHMAVGLLLIFFWFFVYGFKNINNAGAALSGRGARFGLNAGLYTVVVLGLLIVVYYLAYHHNKRWDFTENSVYTLSNQTKGVLSGLNKPLRIIGFKGFTQIDEEGLKDLLSLYKDYNPKLISSDLVDASAKPHIADKYQMKQGNAVYLEYGEGEGKAVSRINESTEQGITNAVIKLSRGAAKKVYYVIGHSEPDIKSEMATGLRAFAGAIADQHLTLDTILLAQTDKLPEDTAAVILCSPKKTLPEREIEIIKKYVEGGGRLLLLLDPTAGDDMRNLAAHFGIALGRDVIIDVVQKLFDAPGIGMQPVVMQYGVHPITKPMRQEDITVFNIASSVTAAAGEGKDPKITELAKTGPRAWAEKDLPRLFNEDEPAAAFEEGTDIPGPISLGVAYEKKVEEGEVKQEESQPKFDKVSRVVVFGDSDWIFNMFFAGSNYNRDLVLNSLNWLVGEEGGVSIGKKNMRGSDAAMTRNDYYMLLGASFIVPEFILILGLFIWWRRKYSVGA